MYAVVATGGKQYRVEEGEVLKVEKLSGEVGEEVVLNDVLLYSDGENVNIGQPKVDGAAVKAEIVEQGRLKKVVIFKYKRRKGYRKKQGHKQHFTAIKIKQIEA
ncbi:MAG: 50S ribosomal protein L21 [Thermodesulfobacteriota bacterium]